MNGQEKHDMNLTSLKIKITVRQVQLKEEEVKLKEADQATTAMLSKLEVSPAVPDEISHNFVNTPPPPNQNGGDVPTYISAVLGYLLTPSSGFVVAS